MAYPLRLCFLQRLGPLLVLTSLLQLHAQGRSLKEIANVLNLSEKTVEFHKSHIQQAFSLRSNADLVLLALERGLISINP